MFPKDKPTQNLLFIYSPSKSKIMGVLLRLHLLSAFVSVCEEVVTPWQTRLSNPVQPSRQNSSQGQSEILSVGNYHNK